MTEVDVVVVGAGSAGIAAARQLRQVRPDLSLQVLEAGRRVGGRALTVVAGPGLALDLGCGWFHGAKDNAWARIAAETGFAIDHARSSWDGAGRSLGLGKADHKAAITALDEFFERADQRGDAEPDVPLSALLQPNGRWNGLIEAIGTFINGVELDRASLRDFDRYEPGRGPDTRAVDGYGGLITHCAAPLPITCDRAVRAIDCSGRRIRVDTDGGPLSARTVIVTVSTSVLARGGIRFTPPLPEKIEAASRLPLGLANKLFLALPDPEDFAPETYVMGAADRLRTASYHIRPFGRSVIECYFGGALARELEAAGEAATVSFAREELAAHFGAAMATRLEPLASSAWLSNPLIGGSYSYAEPGAWPQRAILAEPIDDRLFFAGEACSPHRYSTAHGAFETGAAAADRIAALLD